MPAVDLLLLLQRLTLICLFTRFNVLTSSLLLIVRGGLENANVNVDLYRVNIVFSSGSR